MIFKLMLKCLLFFLTTECDVVEIYESFDLSEVSYDAKLLINGELVDGYDTKILKPMSLGDGIYELTLTRKGSNLYKVNYKDIFLETRYCYEYSYGDEVILKWNGYSGQIFFDY